MKSPNYKKLSPSRMWTLEILIKRYGWKRVNAKIYTNAAEVNQDFDSLTAAKLYSGVRIMEYKSWCFDELISISINPIKDEG